MSFPKVFLDLSSVFLTTMAMGQPGGHAALGPTPETPMPSIGAWFWSSDVFENEGYRAHLDRFRDETVYDLLTVSCRLPGREVADPEVHDTLKAVLDYAQGLNIDVAFELDVRLARAAFYKAHPAELQELLRLRTVDLASSGKVSLRIEAESLRDHMNGQTTPYMPVANRLVRVYSFVSSPRGVAPGTVEDITAERCEARSIGNEAIEVVIDCDSGTEGHTACVAAGFALFTPDVFAPHLLEFQRSIVEQYADLRLDGLMKDEWGFPPCFDGCPDKNDYWYSEARAKAYASRTSGRDLVRDCFLMYLGEEGRETERIAAINHFRAMSRERNSLIEDHYYRLAKEFFGRNAYVVTHPTWMPYPGTAEFKKNGLDWWQATRDFAQTDEGTPYCARTSLAKKWGSPVWVNQYYATEATLYEQNVWRHALGGGRINYHPLYPYEGDAYGDLLRSKVMRAEARVRLLNYISRSPVDCPVAVMFGHTCAMNWAGPAYDDVGLALTDYFWRQGYYADLIPTSEIGNAALTINKEGRIRYGMQPYEAVVLYHPEFENPATAEFFRRAEGGPTALFCVGDWTRDFEGAPFDGKAALPESMVRVENLAACGPLVVTNLRAHGVDPHSPATWMTEWSKLLATAAPPQKGHLRLTDGTRIVLAGEKDAAGDPIRTDFGYTQQQIIMDATGVAALRLDADGSVHAFAAGGLREFHAPGIDIELAQPVDVAFWRAGEQSQGVYQGDLTEVPDVLKRLTEEWKPLRMPLAMD
jgi:hypothetical protein